jgi:cell division inhibitor SepF
MGGGEKEEANMGVMDKLMSLMGLGDENEEGGGFDEREEDYMEERAEWRNRRSRSSQIIPLNPVKDPWKVILTEPTAFDDCQQIAEHLKNRRSVIINLESIELGLARRIIDFVGGAIYAVGGSMQKVGASIFMAAPPNTEITGDLLSFSQSKDKDVLSFINRITEEQ